MKKSLVLLVLVSLVLSVVSGCAVYRRPAPNTPPTTPQAPATPGQQGPMGPAGQQPMGQQPMGQQPIGQQPMGQQMNARETVADRVVQMVNNMPEVRQSYAIIIGNVAMVGVDINENQAGEQSNALKTRIATEVRREMPEIAEVWVTADPDLVTRIRDLAGRIARGEPITGFFDEIQTLVRRLEPQRGQ